MKTRNFPWMFVPVLGAALLVAPAPSRAQDQGKIIEEIVARVNDRIITLSDYQKALAAIPQQVQQDCQSDTPPCTPAHQQSRIDDEKKNLLRNMIDQQLLVERAKDMGIDVETDLVKRLDQIRKQDNFATMDAFQKAVEQSGLSWEDYKSQMRDQLLQQKVINQEVGSKVDIGNEEVRNYYDAHKSDFVRPEEVDLSEIFLKTDGKTPDQIAAIKKKADDLYTRIQNGEDFAALAKEFSEGPAKSDGGELGEYQRGQLAKQLEDAVFKLDKGGITNVIQTQTGFILLKVNQHYDAGLQPLDKVENDITNRLYAQKMEPALREYLQQLREESYIRVRAGYKDTAAVAGGSVIEEVPTTPDTPETKKHKRRLPFPKSDNE
ncbi:MAG TPA: peptidylprolyl isomerase [Candidatus Dormibacteraeota bacterium]|nr:peptidylprolyl isomerase [Candidatus Dormibacteraeota bacterium]